MPNVKRAKQNLAAQPIWADPGIGPRVVWAAFRIQKLYKHVKALSLLEEVCKQRWGIFQDRLEQNWEILKRDRDFNRAKDSLRQMVPKFDKAKARTYGEEWKLTSSPLENQFEMEHLEQGSITRSPNARKLVKITALGFKIKSLLPGNAAAVQWVEQQLELAEEGFKADEEWLAERPLHGNASPVVAETTSKPPVRTKNRNREVHISTWHQE